MFTHLHVHSSYSLLDSTIRIKTKEEYGKGMESLVEACVRMGMPAVALTEHNNLHSAYKFEKECKHHGVQPIYGIELVMDGFPLVFLAQNGGYEQLLAINNTQPSSVSQLQPEQVNHLLVLTGGVGGYLYQQLLQNKEADASNYLTALCRLFGQDNVYVELCRHGLPNEQDIIHRLYQLAGIHHCEVVATNDVHYLFPEHESARSVLMELKDDVPAYENHTHYNNQFDFKSTEEMKALFVDIPQAITNTQHIASRCAGVSIPVQKNLPTFEVPDGYTTDTYFAKVCRDGLVFRGLSHLPNYQQQIEFEIEQIQNLGFSAYFLIVSDFIRYAKRQGIPIGHSRGSVGGSLASYCMEISNVDPMEHELYFERFLNPQRVSLPDIDTDICFERRGEVIDYVRNKYGDEYVAQIATFGTLSTKAVLKDVGRVLGVPYLQMDELTKEVAGETISELKTKWQSKLAGDERLERVMQICEILEDLPRHTSIHAAGVVISPKPLAEVIPVMQVDGMQVTQWDKKEVEAVGTLKFDFLGLKTLTIMEKTYQQLQKQGIDLNLNNTPIHHPSIYDYLRTGQTARIFQLESAGMQRTIKGLQPTTFDDIVAILALYRPATLELIDTYIENKRNGTFDCPHPMLQPILKPTQGIMVYQEQIQQVAKTLAGYSLGEADILRRAISDKNANTLQKEGGTFIAKAKANGVDEEIAKPIFDLIVKFAGYGFNKAHSVGYGVLTAQTAYLKANHPKAFMCANLNVAIGNTQGEGKSTKGKSADKQSSILAECKRMGIPVYPPTLGKAKAEFHVEGEGIRFGYLGIRGVGKEFARFLETQSYPTFEEWVLHTPYRMATKVMWENLIHAGACDELVNRGTALASLETLLSVGKRKQDLEQKKQLSLFDVEQWTPTPSLTIASDLEYIAKLKKEQKVLETVLSGHPLDAVQDLIARFNSYSISELDDTMHGQTVWISGVLESFRPLTTKTGQKMAFVQVSDTSEQIEVIVFPKVFARVQSLLQPMIPMMWRGKVEYDVKSEQVKLMLDNVKPLLQANERLYVEVKNEQEQIKLTQHLHRQNGVTPVTFFRNDTEELISSSVYVRLNMQTAKQLQAYPHRLIQNQREL